MKSRLTQLFLATILTLSMVLNIFVLLPGRASALSYPYNPSYLVNEKLFEGSGAMSVSAIQTFLNNEGSGIRTLTDVESCSPPTPTLPDPYASSYYPHCGHTESAAQIIYDAGNAYGISPRVILATMQKEESLVTDPTPWQNNSGAVNCAMGYTEGHASCADSPVQGFFEQVDNGSWQFRTYIELMNGRNWWGYAPSTYPCKNGHDVDSSNNLYSTGLYPGSTVTFYNSGGTAKTISLDNSATAALYCYTPYVGPKVTTYGYTGTGYSGSFNFVIDWDQWWGSSQGNYFDVASQSSVHQNIEYGHTQTLNVVLDNTSVDTWYSDDCAATHSAHAYRLMTLGYTNTPFADTSANVTTSTGSNPAWLGTQNQVRMIDCSVPPGGTATFKIPLKAPLSSTTQLTKFELVQNGVAVYGDDIAYFYLSAIPDYAYDVVSADVPPGIYPGDAYQIVIKLKNTGAETWYSDTDRADPGNTSGHPIRLATSGYKTSPFAYPNQDGNWLDYSQIQMQGNSVAPGATATFQATIYAPYQKISFTHNFRLVLDGVKFIGGTTIPATVSVPSPVATYSIVSRSGPSTMTSGQTASFTVVLKNTGNIIWRNVHRKVDGNSTQLPLRDVRMLTWSPGYHTSYFWNTTPEWMGTHNQLTPTTAIAGPGKTATYNITFRAPHVTQKTFFNEQWNLVLDGQTVMPFQGLTFPITVNP